MKYFQTISVEFAVLQIFLYHQPTYVCDHTLRTVTRLFS